MRSITRRHVFVAIPAASLSIATRTDTGLNHPASNGLLALRPLWQEALAVLDAVLSAKAPLERRCFSRRAPVPDQHCFSSYDEYQAAIARFDADVAAIELEEGLVENERLEILAMDTYHAIVDRIVAAPSRTVSDLLFKAEVSKGFAHTNECLTRAIIDDLVTVHGGACLDTAVAGNRKRSAAASFGSGKCADADHMDAPDPKSSPSATPSDEGRSHE